MPSAVPDSVSFSSQIRPILSDKCFACHGPDHKTREADLRLDLRQSLVERQTIVPGSPDESELFRRILLTSDDDQKMPPNRLHKELTDEEKDLIRRWITQGATYEQHWSYQPLKSVPVPKVAEPDKVGSDNPIDVFLIDSLQRYGLGFSEPADRVTLIRRLYLDLVGMPPTQEETRAFLDDSSSDSLNNAIERLLQDTRFGERLAVYWLDLVRYADTIGYHSDNFMEVSAYRDYVINAFNENKPFDRFTIEQLAGDLLPNPSQEQLVASGYNRLLQTTEEGGAQAKEYLAIYAADRVRNLSGVWLGQTVGCAQCHDHKYDPYTTKDFYSLAAFFADIDERAVGKRNPNYKLIRPDQERELAAKIERVGELQIEKRLASDVDLARTLREGQARWEADIIRAMRSTTSPWRSPESLKVASTGGIKLQSQEDGSFLSTGANPDTGIYTCTIESTKPISAIRLEVLPDSSFPNKQGFSRSNGNFVLTNVEVFRGDQAIPITEVLADYEQRSWPIAHVIDQDQKTGWAVDGHQRPAEKHVAIFRLHDNQNAVDRDVSEAKEANNSSWKITLHHDSNHAKHLIGRFRLTVTDQPAAGIDETVDVPEQVLKAIDVASQDRNREQQEVLRNHYHSIAPELNDARKQLADAQKAVEALQDSLQTMLISKSLAEPRMMRILPRGNWLDETGDVVEPALPGFLPSEAIIGRRATRLDLARWLVDKQNPLTARVFVNRLWKLFFGKGLARNLDDLGGQGEPPTHPELLDWLAIDFRDSGWDIKRLVRLMVTSNAYAQSSTPSAGHLTKDPLNQLFGRQGRWRLEAEFVRDTALSISGLLITDTIGGRSAKPYQPTGYWQHLNFPRRQWQAESGSNLYRRGLYTFWCRSFLHPALLAFDAPSREECTAQRSRSNTPQQALVLLNDPVFVEASRVFAKQIMSSANEKEDQIAWAIRQAMSRDPRAEEITVLRQLYEKQLEHFMKSPQDALDLLQVGAAETTDAQQPDQLAAWTQVARAILNAYETTSRF